MLKIVLVASLLLNSSQTASADEQFEIPSPAHEIELHLGQKAPFSGVLIDLDQFRYYKTQELEAESLSKAFATSQTEGLWPKIILPFLVGLSAGVLIDKVLK